MALRESEQRFRLMFEQSVAAMGIGDLQARVVQTNRAFQELLGYSEEELQHLSAFDFVHPDDQADMERNLKGERAVRTVRKFRHKDGHTVWGRLSAVMIKPESRAGYWVCIVQDITAEKQAEEILRESEERFRIVANDTPAYLWTLTLENESATLFVNRRLSEFLGTGQMVSDVDWSKYVYP
ncbi:MAG: PAS domain S-box protein, partial [Acidobacteriaceae bacterium]|nr:PAS domain S-box protein [Acidobacteriaceae bacterium]